MIPLNAEERKRHEFLDCLIIELLGKEVLPYAGTLPRDFMEMVIGILNRGSINTMDVNDVMGKGESHFMLFYCKHFDFLFRCFFYFFILFLLFIRIG